MEAKLLLALAFHCHVFGGHDATIEVSIVTTQSFMHFGRLTKLQKIAQLGYYVMSPNVTTVNCDQAKSACRPLSILGDRPHL